MQLDIGELYDLLRLSDLPDSWDDQERFREFYKTQMVLEEALAMVDDEPVGFGALYNDTERAFQRQYEEMFGVGLSTEEVKRQLRMFAQMVADHAAAYPGYSEYVNEITDPSRSQHSLDLNDRTNIKKLFDPEKRTFNNPGDILYECSKDGWNTVVEMSKEMNPVQSRVFRNTRSVLRDAKEEGRLDETVPRREVATEEIDLDSEMRALFDEVEEYIRKTYQLSEEVLKDKERAAIGFVMTTYRQRLSSSIHGISESLRRRRDRLDKEIDTRSTELERLAESSDISETDVEELLGTGQIDAYQPTENEVVQLEKAEIDSFIDDLERVQNDPKGERLIKDITTIREKGKDKIVIFTQYTDTLEYIADKLTPIHSVGTYSGNGARLYKDGSWQNVGKETIKNEFAGDEVGILICTDSASEGLNLQMGDVLINYDLPWNPMKVEQRIGRIDRIGQENKIVEIINYAYEDGIDKEIYERLDNRLSLFNDVVGDTRPVLTGVESEISELALEGADKGDIENFVSEKEREAMDMKSKVNATGLSADERQTFDDSNLSGWGNQKHPALTSLGSTDRLYQPAINGGAIEHLFTQSQILEEEGWSFTALRNHERKDDYPTAAHDAYLLTVPEGITNPDVAVESADATAQASLRHDDSVVVTFSPDLAQDFPSLRLLLPGDPLFTHLLETIQTEGQASRSTSDLSFVALPCDSDNLKKSEQINLNEVELVLPRVTGKDVCSIGLNTYSDKDADRVLDRWMNLG
jgi:hypothetical protein